MTRQARIISLVPLLAYSACHALAVPIDSNAARRLPQIAAIVEKVKAGTAPDRSDEEKLYAEVEAGQPALAALSIWALGETRQNKYVDRLLSARDHLGGLASAFATIALAKCAPDWEATKTEKLKNFLSKMDNPYLPIEAARELASVDPPAAADTLQKILQQPGLPGKSAAAEVLDRLGQPHEPIAPVEDDPYYIVLQTLEPAEHFMSHKLAAVNAGTTVTAPFPSQIERIIFSWTLNAEQPNDPIEIRWIAADVAAVEKNHTIATSKSEPDKRKGEFNLKKPTAGFPRGQYRVEIWQAETMIYSEKFEIKSD